MIILKQDVIADLNHCSYTLQKILDHNTKLLNKTESKKLSKILQKYQKKGEKILTKVDNKIKQYLVNTELLVIGFRENRKNLKFFRKITDFLLDYHKHLP